MAARQPIDVVSAARRTIAVFFALPVESRYWRAPDNARVVITGVGARGFASIADDALAQAEFAIVAGLAGGLTPRLRCGAVIVPRRLHTGDPSTAIASDERLVALASSAGATIVDALLSSNRVVGGAAEKAALGAHADAVDMESFIVLREAAARGVPGIAIRVVGDAADEDLPVDFNAARKADGGFSAMRVAAMIARRPDRWPAVWRFAVAQRHALQQLARFLDRFVAASGGDGGNG